MKKVLHMICLLLAVLIFSAYPVSAAGNTVSRLTDLADLLSDNEKTQLLDELDEISLRQQADIVVVTVKSLEGKTPMEYADDFYDQNGYGFGDEKDGILFLISMEERDWHISTRGAGITAVTDAGLEYMSDQFLDDLKEGEYAEAFTVFARLCDDFLTQAQTGTPYDTDFLPKEPFSVLRALLISLGAGFLLSFLAAEYMKSRLKTVHSQAGAENYVKAGSMKLTKEKDLFLYKHISRVERPKDTGSQYAGQSGGSSTHTSSSGATHGGGGGKF